MLSKVAKRSRNHSPTAPNYNPQQINPQQKRPTKISLISLKSNVVQASQSFIKKNLKSTADSTPRAARSGFVCFPQTQQQLATRHRDSETAKGPGRLPCLQGPRRRWDAQQAPSPARGKEQWGAQLGQVTAQLC